MGGLFHIKYYKNTEICHITSCAYPLLGTKLFRLKFPRSCYLSPKPPNKDAIPPHRKQWGILASFRELLPWPHTLKMASPWREVRILTIGAPGSAEEEITAYIEAVRCSQSDNDG